jgi:hypothetical protein
MNLQMAARLSPCANLYIKRVSKEKCEVDDLKSCPDFPLYVGFPQQR